MFVNADRHDVSPALRNIRPLPPQAGAVLEAPSFRRARGQRSRDPIVQASPVAPLAPSPSTSVDGLGNANNVLPPDTNGDVGPNHFVQWVNLSFAVYSKGSVTEPPVLLYGPAAGNTLWAGFGGPCETTNNGDPVVRYDHLSDRWVMSQLSLPNAIFGLIFGPFYQCIAVSATPDPTGPYYRYQYSFAKLNDYPKFGVWPDGYYMGINQFTSGSLQWAGQGVAAFDRTRMLNGEPAGMIYFDLAPVDMNLGGMLPSDVDGPPPPAGSPNYFVQADDDLWGYSPDQLQVWQFHADWAVPSASTFTHAAFIATAPFDSQLCGGSRSCIPQPGTGATLDPLSDRLMYRLQYRNFGGHESLVVNHTVDADGGGHAGVRWYELRDPRDTPFIHQQGTYAPDADHRWMGSAAMDSAGNLAVGFSVSSGATYPSVRYAARVASDPPGVLAQGEAVLVDGGGSQTHSSGRWGDYSMLVVDPSDDCTFWYTQQYYAGTSSAAWRTRIAAFKFPSCVPPSSDLPVVTVAATAPTATEAGPASGAFTITRTGNTSAPLTINYSTGGTAAAGSDYLSLPGVLTIDAGSATAAIPVVPLDDSQVESNETVVLSIGPDQSYSGSPGTALITVVSDDLPPDLVVSAVSAPAAAAAGSTISITDTTANPGGGPSAASTTAVYFSKNIFLDTTDVLLGSRSVPPLAPGASVDGTTSVVIPADTVTGTYYIVAKADGANAIPESQETNNTKWSNPVNVGPDLIVSSLGVPASSAAGGSMTLGEVTANQGAGAAPSSTTTFSLSANYTLDAADVLLGNRTVPALAGNTSSPASTSVTLPLTTATGTYYVIAKADAGTLVAEANEFNNLRVSSQVRVGPDLTITATTAQGVAGAGSTIAVGDTTKNQGAAPAGASSTGFYLSPSYTLGSSSVFLGSRSVPPLGAGAADTGTASVRVPTTVATGSYYVIATADANAVVAEASETNNAGFGALVRIGPDLTVSALSAPFSTAAGSTTSVNSTVLNQGGGASPASTTRLYLSTNATLDASDLLVGTAGVGPLDSGQSASGSTTVTVPAGTAPGYYFLIAVADGDAVVTETLESNNTRLVSVQVISGM
ncbi:MAG: hypothetical protein A3G21_06525 [Acidobacteria bacterium RIFCSPLOWO2_12_FULL_66_21]|nr:MAG: hypothetical protein A3G21_06525 [Acidobacteria bacterium RIFCSPLOWO2_12_FULL_66_21]